MPFHTVNDLPNQIQALLEITDGKLGRHRDLENLKSVTNRPFNNKSAFAPLPLVTANNLNDVGLALSQVTSADCGQIASGDLIKGE